MDLKDVVESFFHEEAGISSTENAVSKNVSLFKAKFKGGVPLPKRFAPAWSVVLGKESVEIGGSKVEVSICRPTLAAKDTLDSSVTSFLATVDPSTITKGAVLDCSMDGANYSLKEGEDFWTSTAAKVEAMKSLEWL